jgi:hypothetical protein
MDYRDAEWVCAVEDTAQVSVAVTMVAAHMVAAPADLAIRMVVGAGPGLVVVVVVVVVVLVAILAADVRFPCHGEVSA